MVQKQATPCTADSTVVAQRLTDLLQRFPSAAIRGVQWQTLAQKYEERYGTKQDLNVLGAGSALATASALLWDVVRIVECADTDNPILAIEDNVALTPQPGCLASWPSLYRALCEIAQEHGTAEESGDANSTIHSILLSQVKPMLQKRWHPHFDDIGLAYFTEEGSSMKLKKMKHLLQALLRWRAERVSWRNSASVDSRNAVDVAVKMQLEMGPSQTKNDIVLRCICQVDHSTIIDAPLEYEFHVSQEVPYPEKDVFSDVSTHCSEPSTPSNRSSSGFSTASYNAELQQELDRLRHENSKLQVEKRLLESQHDHMMTTELSELENLFDNPSEPPPEIPILRNYSPATTSFGIWSGSVTPHSEISLSGSCTPIPCPIQPAMAPLGGSATLMPAWFPVGDRFQIPGGIVQQACAVFERHATIPSFFAQRMQ